MFIKNNNMVIILAMVTILFYFIRLFFEDFIAISNCPSGQIEGSDGKCKCPLVGQIYDKNNKKCVCDYNKKEIEIDGKLVCN